MDSSTNPYICAHPCDHPPRSRYRTLPASRGSPVSPPCQQSTLPNSHHSNSNFLDKFNLLNTFYKWKHPVYTLLCWSSFIHLSSCLEHSSMLHISFILFHYCVVFHLWICHLLFTHSIVDGNLGCLQFGAIMNTTSVKILYISFGRHKHLFLSVCPGLDLPGHALYNCLALAAAIANINSLSYLGKIPPYLVACLLNFSYLLFFPQVLL